MESFFIANSLGRSRRQEINLAGRKQDKTQRYHHHPILPTLGALSRAIRAHVIQICVANDTVCDRSNAWYET